MWLRFLSANVVEDAADQNLSVRSHRD